MSDQVTDPGAADPSGPAAARAPWPEILARLVRGEDLPREQATAAMQDIMAGRADPARIGGFLIGLRAKGETADEVGAAAQAMRAAARPWPGAGGPHSANIPGGLDGDPVPGSPGVHGRPESPEGKRACVDIVGTGGDNSGTVNISTLAAVIVAACGIAVVKHGNRAATSASGAADVLEALGLPLDATPQTVARIADEVGLGFAFAPVFHPAMRYAAPVRRSLGVPTVFNILGPLTNPAAPVAGLIGCADARLAPVMAAVFADRGERMLVVRGEDGWDEITPQADTRMWVSGPAGVTEAIVSPQELGLAGISGSDLAGGDAEHNAEVMRIVLGLPRVDAQIPIMADPQAVAAVAIANAAATLAIAATAGLPGAEPPGTQAPATDRGSWAERIAAELPRAREAVGSGAAGRLLTRWIQRTRDLTD